MIDPEYVKKLEAAFLEAKALALAHHYQETNIIGAFSMLKCLEEARAALEELRHGKM